ncbi:adenylyl-sulfate kinase [Oceanibacterium hippocampi]|uniref:Adenylyl-sulfate kinase n=1 Tax=Oceanibacterium hippocampi TaxID=745714 RepID=A0A1Y5S7D7_9PROT|nr:adenylyl-sulfate kinase [Oceanibacterium hippocampi]SLN34157.1 Bifunctional enzyme CysN/CysC [Oceanibacterium hippocampi]
MTELTPVTTGAKQSNRARRESMNIVIVGHVDHGKSTLVGRLMHDTGSLPDGKVESIKAMSERRGMPFEWAFLLDALQAERDQGITIDTTQIQFRTKQRDYVLIDAPGHKEFLKNMITGAAAAEAALLVIDAAEGVQEQSRRHGYLLHLLGVQQVAIAVNKMDLVDFDGDRFHAIEDEFRRYLKDLGVEASALIPVSARGGDNIATRSEKMSWYGGPTVVEALDAFRVGAAPVELPLRMPVQDVYKFDQRRIVAGRIESGRIRVGDELLFSPSNKTARVRTVEAWSVPEAPTGAQAGQSIGITLDDQLFLERGSIASHVSRPPVETDVFRARVFWLGHEPMKVGSRYKLKHLTAEAPVTVQSIQGVVETGDLARRDALQVRRNEVAEVTLRAGRLLALDAFSDNSRTGRFVLVDGYDIAGGGIISMEGYPDQRNMATVRSANITRVEHRISPEERLARNGHAGAVLWFTGLSGAGKSTLALEVESRLFARGYQAYVLDGDNIRGGLNANLGFSPEDRAENIRRVGEVAALFARAGMIAISAFISPYRADRDRARSAASGSFREIYIKADLETCESRDPKGLYKRARTGEIKEFTGISAPYEAPESAELVVDTSAHSIEECVQQIVDYVQREFAQND